MALKIWLNGAMNKIDTNLHKPVIFLNGTKYKLDKAYTFVNGEKQQIWGESGVQIDYISSDGVLGGGIPFAVGENWLNCYYNNTIYRIDISNLSSPSLIQSIVWGNLVRYNNYQSSASTNIFEGWNANTRTNYKFSMNNSTGAMSVVSSLAFTPTSSDTNSSSYICATNNAFIDMFSTLVSLRPYQVWNRNAYWNNTKKYEQSSVLITPYFQDSADTFIGRWTLGGTTSSYIFSASGKTAIGGSIGLMTYTASIGSTSAPQELFVDSGYVYSANLTTVIKTPANDLTQNITYSAPADTKPYLLGKIGNYLYVLTIPTITITPDSVVKLVLLDADDLSVAFEKVLPNDPFGENYGYPYFWTNVNGWTIPQVSETGFLSFGRYDNSTLGLRVARFSGIF